VISISFPAEPDPDPHPRYEDYPTTRAYEQAFHMWHARRRDERLTDEERQAAFAVTEDYIKNRRLG
jgi:hypothetical protein